MITELTCKECRRSYPIVDIEGKKYVKVVDSFIDLATTLKIQLCTTNDPIFPSLDRRVYKGVCCAFTDIPKEFHGQVA